MPARYFHGPPDCAKITHFWFVLSQFDKQQGEKKNDKIIEPLCENVSLDD